MAIEGTQHRLGAGELDHALAGLREVALKRLVGPPPQACIEQHHCNQYWQRQ
ncbi:hypothetical protein D3C76_1596940 [compost metagenome]